MTRFKRLNASASKKKIIAIIALLVGHGAFASCLAIKSDFVFSGEKLYSTTHYTLIEGQKIAKLNQSSVPSNCKIIERAKSTLLPGLIDAHSLLFLEDPSLGTDFYFGLISNSKRSEKERMTSATKKLNEYLAAGFTSLRDLGNSGQYLDLKLRNEIDEKIRPRLFISGPGITAVGAQFSLGTSPKIIRGEYDQVFHSKDIETLACNHEINKVDQIKIYADNSPNPNFMHQKFLIRLVNKAKEKGMRSAIHAVEEKSIERAIEANPNSIEHAFLATDAQFAKMAQKGIILVPTDLGDELVKTLTPALPSPLKETFVEVSHAINKLGKTRLQKAKQAGVTIAFGSDYYFPSEQYGVPFMEGVRSSLYALNDFGLTIEEALKSATKNAAHLIGRNDLGEIKPGATADLILIDGTLGSIRDIRNILLVIKDGTILINNLEKKQ